MGIEYPEDFLPEPGYDIAYSGSLHLPGFYLIHELGPWEETCWCEPEIVGYDYETDFFIYKHRRHQ